MSQLSKSELAILKVLWTDAPLSAREIQERVGQQLDWSFSTTRTTLSRMVDKALLRLDTKHGVRVYTPVESKARTLSGVMREFFDTFFEMKGPLPTAAFHDSKILSEEEWLELDRLLNENGDND
ncbi:BlaI/MecI/CopY family transcriptional regulator [Hyphococcus flavus]|uniref:BlaI/MecI/CopY family transcriptional regulator n=1 Tax=Hyphococcus flavus TaxID=1866326 RepID=A0AAF0CFJ1_9PROT|nr:BlaI/MecI/CopY family transcriptional regulator [Hyphococcus flavus]WDI31454.1 BlaI/MecI/CopY family transcriptional regulator [Hyphococcus flavus]